MSEENYIKCPFCGEDDFDLEGLKAHLLNSWCPVFDDIPTWRVISAKTNS